VDQLPAAGAEARHVLAGGGGDGDEPPRHARQQVSALQPDAACSCSSTPAQMIEATHTSPRCPALAFAGIILVHTASPLRSSSSSSRCRAPYPSIVPAVPARHRPSWRPSGTRRKEQAGLKGKTGDNGRRGDLFCRSGVDADVHAPRRCTFEFRRRSFPFPARPAPRVHVANSMIRTALLGVNIC
jgi:hypothetical protein